MKILLSAYSCQPGGGSEAGVGWSWAQAAAQDHEVWLLTAAANRPRIDDALATSTDQRIHPVYIDEPTLPRPLARGSYGAYARYIGYQRRVARTAPRLHREVGFDVAHHVTLATEFVPIGIAKLRSVPLVIGPIGGIAPLSLSLWRWLGWRGAVTRVINEPIIRAMRRVFVKRAVERAAVSIALSEGVAAFYDVDPPMHIQPHAGLDEEQLRFEPMERQRHVAVFAGRLVAWKGLRIAIAAMAEPAAAAWRLEVLGEGPDRAALQQYATKLGVADRVTFHGWCAREDVLSALRRAHCLIYPSLLDASPWIVAEAVSLGTPVACFDGLGPATLVRGHGGALIERDRKAPARFAAALAALPLGVDPSTAWMWGRLPGFVNEVYAQASNPGASRR